MCFSLMWLKDILVWAVIVGAIFAILRLLVPFILSQFGVAGGMLSQVINIFFWAFACIVLIYVCFMLISCLGGGSLMPPLPHGRL